jgi:hypothetical protein
MELLASLFVGKPLTILAVAALFLAAHVALRSTPLGDGRNRAHQQIWLQSLGCHHFRVRGSPKGIHS